MFYDYILIQETYKLHWILFLIGFEIMFYDYVLFYYTMFEGQIFDNSTLDNIKFKKWDDILLHKNNIIYVCCLQAKQLGRPAYIDEVFMQTHIRKSNGEFVD